MAPLLSALGALACALLLLGLVARWASLVAPAVALAGAEYAVFLLLERESVDPAAPLVGGGFVLTGELAYAALYRQSPAADFGARARRILTFVATVAGSIAAGAVVLVAAGVSVGGGLLLEALGVLAAAGTVAVVALLAWQAREEHVVRR